MNKLHPAVILAAGFAGAFAAVALARSLLTGDGNKPKAVPALTSDIPATTVANVSQPDENTPAAASGTATTGDNSGA